MTEKRQVEIKERARSYDIKVGYHSDLMCENFDVEILAAQEPDGKISFTTGNGCRSFEFIHSDPDRVIAIADMFKTFAEMAKKENAIDTLSKE